MKVCKVYEYYEVNRCAMKLGRCVKVRDMRHCEAGRQADRQTDRYVMSGVTMQGGWTTSLVQHEDNKGLACGGKCCG